MKHIFLLYLTMIAGLYAMAQNVGVGTTSPTEKLDVSGNIRSTGTVKANNVQFNTPKTYYYSISGADFVAKESTDQIYREGTSAGGAFFLTSTDGMVAPAHLPHGATVTKMTAYFFDQGIAIDLTVRLRYNTGFNLLASVTSTGSPGSGTLVDNSITNEVIDNSINAYIVDAVPAGGAWPGNSLRIHRVIIEYQLSQL